MAAQLPHRPPLTGARERWSRLASHPALLTFGSNATIQGAAFIGSVVIARRFGLHVRGEYAAAAAWCALLTAISDFGVSQGVRFRCARAPMTPGRTIGTGLVFVAVSATLAALLGLVAVLVLISPRDPKLGAATAVFLPSIPIMLVGSCAAVASQGLGLVRTFNLIRLVLSLATITGIALSIGLHATTSAAVMGMIVMIESLAMLLSLFMLHRHATATSWRFDRGELRELLRFGIRAHLGSLAGVANGRLDQMLMGILLGTSDVALYSIAASYSGLVFALACATTDSNFVSLAEEIPIAERLRRVRISLIRITRLSLGIGTVLALVAVPLFPFIYGPDYRASILPAIILIVGGMLLGLNYTIGVGLRGSGRPILTSIAEGVGLLVTLIGLPLVLIRYGIVAAALVSVASYAMTFATLVFFAHRLAREPEKTGPAPADDPTDDLAATPDLDLLRP